MNKIRAQPIKISDINEIIEFPDEACGRCLKKIMKIRNLEKRINQIKGYIKLSTTYGKEVTINGETYRSITQAMRILMISKQTALRLME